MNAARLTDAVTHPTPNLLSGSPSSLDVSIGGLPAWRAVPAALGAALDAAAAAIMAVLEAPVLNPALAGPLMAPVQSGLLTAAALSENPAAAAATNAALAGVTTGMVTLDTAWTTASAAPGGQPGADQAYGEGLQMLLAGAAATAFASIAAGMDIHMCGVMAPIPHGPGVVTVASQTVSVNGLPLARKGDSVVEAAGGSNPIVGGHPQVTVG